MSRIAASLLVLLAAAIWGIAYYFQKSAMDHIGPLQFLASRGALAAIVLLPLALREGRGKPGSAAAVTPLALRGGVLFFAAAAIQQIGMVTATVTNTGFLTALYVVVTPFLLWLLASEKPGLRVWLAAILACLGIWGLGGGTLQGFSHGDVLVAVSSLGWSLFMVNTSLAAKHARPVLYTCISFASVAVLAGAATFVLESHDWQATRAALPAILYVGILSSALTFSLTAIAMRHIPASHVSILLSMETLVAAAAGHIMLGENLSALGWAGAALVIVAVLLIQWQPQQRGAAEAA